MRNYNMENYEEYIKLNNKELYEAIHDHIDLMPDFRPLDTVKRMKHIEINGNLVLEPQNNWRKLYDELCALNYNKYATEIINSIMNNELSSVIKELHYDSMNDMIFSYPALIWSLRYISSEESTWALYLSRGIYLEDIPMKREYVGYIQDFETAEKINSLYPNLFFLSYFSERISKYKTEHKNNLIGFVYWFGSFYYDKYIYYFEEINNLIFQCNDIDLLKKFVSKIKSEERSQIIYNIICLLPKEGTKEQVRYVVKEILTYDELIILLRETLNTKQEEIWHKKIFSLIMNELGIFSENQYDLYSKILVPSCLKHHNVKVVKRIFGNIIGEKRVTLNREQFKKIIPSCHRSTFLYIITKPDLFFEYEEFIEECFIHCIRKQKIDKLFILCRVSPSLTQRFLYFILDFSLEKNRSFAFKMITKTYNEYYSSHWRSLLNRTCHWSRRKLVKYILNNLPVKYSLHEDSIREAELFLNECRNIYIKYGKHI